MRTKKVFKVPITVGSYSNIVDEIILLPKVKVSSYVCLCNVHMLIEAVDDKNFLNVLENADIVTPDGVPVAKSVEFFYKIKQPRVAGMDLIDSLFSAISKNNMSVFFYGSTDNVLKKLTLRAVEKYPGLNVVNTISPPFRNLTFLEERNIIDEINSHNPDFLFVALGCPKQEKWMYKNRNLIKSCMIGLGGAFPVYAGIVKRSPKWMQNYGLEWLYRLIKEPNRLFKRYFYTNTKFLLLFFFSLVKVKIFRNING